MSTTIRPSGILLHTVGTLCIWLLSVQIAFVIMLPFVLVQYFAGRPSVGGPGWTVLCCGALLAFVLEWIGAMAYFLAGQMRVQAHQEKGVEGGDVCQN